MLIPKTSQKQKKRVFLLAVVIGLFFLSISTWNHFAQDIPQQIGFKDVEYGNLTRNSCVECHGESVADTHHETKQASDGDCTSCHDVSKTPGKVDVSKEKNCMKCHTKSPHHKTESAKDNECTGCHDSPGVSDYSTEIPSNKISNLTPTTASCKNCHKEGVSDGQKIVGIKKTHHGIALKGCNTCHDEKDKKNTSIRICQRCHSVEAIHEVLPHVKKENCVKCHSGKKNPPEKK